MNVTQTLRFHSHHLGPFANEILDQLGETLADQSQSFVVLVPTHTGIKALAEAALGFAHDSHSPHDHIAVGENLDEDLETLSGQTLSVERDGLDLLCNGVIVHATKTDNPLQATNGTIYTIDRPLQFYDAPASSS
ncbi:MAG: hypothetical protein CMP20_04620 [Rickettsiales bacterium]|nr:hypothetical protein [Rickettsiales bacterium]